MLLATDRALFDPANASRRTPASFYASREHSGLIRANGEPAVYLVPTAVIQRLAGAREIFYTAACYRSAQGQDPAYAISPPQLSREAPSVGVASDFQGRALAASFAIPADVLLRVRDDDGHSSTVALDLPDVVTHATGDADSDADADRVGGEDGYGMSAALDDEDDEYGDTREPISAAAEDPDDESEYAPAAERAQSSGAALDYCDGYDDPIPASAASNDTSYGENGDDSEDEAPADAQESTYAAGARTPAMLEDEDENHREDEGAYAAATAYGDEADEEAAIAPAYEALDTVALTETDQRRIMDILLATTWPGQTYASVVPETAPTSAPYAGLSFGIAPFTQWSGALGELLKVMEKRDAGALQRIFGPKWKDLRDTATAAKAADRMKAVDGQDLWREPWLTRFKKAGEHKPFQAAQNETAAALYLKPMIPIAYGLGLNSDRGLAMLAALVRRLSFNLESPVSVALDWAVTAVSPLKTDAQRQQALATLGAAFQKAQQIKPDAKAWSNIQHYEVLAALRKGGHSPVPLPTRAQMLDLMVKRAIDYKDLATGELGSLRTVGTLKDVEYAP